MHIINNFLVENFVDHVSIDLHVILDSINKLMSDFEGIDVLRDAVTNHGDGDTDTAAWVRNKIVQSAVIIMDHYGITIEEETPIDVIVGLLKPILKFNEPEVRDMWAKVDTQELDNEEMYCAFAEQLFVFDGYPVANVLEVKADLIEIFIDEDEMETELLLRSTRNDLRRSLLRMRSDLGRELMTYTIPLGMDLVSYVRLFMTEEEEEEKSAHETEQYVIDLYMLSHFCSEDSNEFISILNEYFNDRYTDSHELLTLNHLTNKIEREYHEQK